MKIEAITSSSSDWIGKVARNCGEVTIGCTEVAGIVEAVLEGSRGQIEGQAKLGTAMDRLTGEQAAMRAASDEARMLSDRAAQQLQKGANTVVASGDELVALIDRVEHLGSRIIGFAAAVEQVARVSSAIDQIARTTNMVALNAAIEAQKAGVAGATFAVVAAEVKTLANDTRAATVEISATMGTLAHEARQFMTQISESVERSKIARSHFAEIEDAMTSAGEIVVMLDAHNDEIARRATIVEQQIIQSRLVIDQLDEATETNAAKLGIAHSTIVDVEGKANDMFDGIVHSDFSPADSYFVQLAQEELRGATLLTEAAIDSGQLDMATLFDAAYRPITGSNPPRFKTRLCDWADINWRPIIDRIRRCDPRILGVGFTDMNGYLPTHATEFSRPPTGDVAHDTLYCRNGRILFDATDQRAKRSDADYIMSVYRQEGDANGYKVVRNVCVPLTIKGRRWGDLELAYSV